MSEKLKTTGKIVGIGLVGALLGGAGVAQTIEPETINNTVIQEKVIEVPVTVTEIVEVEVPVEVPVDNENLALVLEHIYDNAGSVEYLTEDLDDDELDLIVERVLFINDAKDLSVAEVKSELFDEIDGELITLSDNSTVELDENDMERLRIDSDDDEIMIDSVDFDNKDADVIVTGSFEQDDIKYEFSATVEIKDGEVEEIKSFTIVEA